MTYNLKSPFNDKTFFGQSLGVVLCGVLHDEGEQLQVHGSARTARRTTLRRQTSQTDEGKSGEKHQRQSKTRVTIIVPF